MNLTDKQRDLLQTLVSNYESNGGSEFYFTRSMSNSGVSYSGANPTSFPCQDLDLDALRRTGFVQLVPVSKNVVRGQPTRLGIEVIGANPSPDRAQRQAEIQAIPTAEGNFRSTPRSTGSTPRTRQVRGGGGA
jgi:hypothetical protein